LKKSGELGSAAREALANAYAPYSHLRVGAAVLTSDGKVFTGCNVENAVFAVTICAERTAISKAVSQGSNSIKSVVVVSDAEEPLLPCGMCLQTISEFASGRDTKIVSIGKNGRAESFTLGKLFPSGIKVNRTIRSVTD
jgi:cytidine deaminase